MVSGGTRRVARFRRRVRVAYPWSRSCLWQVGSARSRAEMVAAIAELGRQEQDALRLDQTCGPIVDPDARHSQPREPDRTGTWPHPCEPIGPALEERVEPLQVRGRCPGTGPGRRRAPRPMRARISDGADAQIVV